MRVGDAAQWGRIRAGGRPRFLLVRGVLLRGLPLGVLSAVAIELALGGSLPAALGTLGFLGRLALCCSVFSATGLLNAQLLWGLYERRYGSG